MLCRRHKNVDGQIDKVITVLYDSASLMAGALIMVLVKRSRHKAVVVFDDRSYVLEVQNL